MSGSGLGFSCLLQCVVMHKLFGRGWEFLRLGEDFEKKVTKRQLQPCDQRISLFSITSITDLRILPGRLRLLHYQWRPTKLHR